MTLIERAIKQAEQEHEQSRSRLVLVPKNRDMAGQQMPVERLPKKSLWIVCALFLGMLCGATLCVMLLLHTMHLWPSTRIQQSFLSEKTKPVDHPARAEEMAANNTPPATMQSKAAIPVLSDRAPQPAHAPAPLQQKVETYSSENKLSGAPENPGSAGQTRPKPQRKKSQAEQLPFARHQSHEETPSVRAVSAEELNNAALMYLEQGDRTHARIFLEEALRISPGDEKVLNNLGLVHYQEGRYREAVEYFQRALKGQNNNPDTMVNLGVTYHALKEYHHAERFFTRALSLSADHPEALYNYALLLEDTHRPDAALRYFEKFLKIAPDRLRERVDQVRRYLGSSR